MGENMYFSTYFWVYFVAAFLALFITVPVIWLARRIKAVDYPGVRSVHTQPIPRIGGVAVYLSSMSVMISVLFLDNRLGQAFQDMRLPMITLLCTATLVFLVGLVDDLRGMPARFKFMVELIGACLLYFVGIRIGGINFGEGLRINFGWLSFPVTLLWIVGVTNAVNMSDGLDGLAAGVAAIACGVIAFFSIYCSVSDSSISLMSFFAIALLGSLSGFLFFNFNPAKVFMGDCGSLFIGFTIASASVMCAAKSATLVGLALPALALGIPIFDALFSMLRRFLERRSLFAPDRSHFHHRLVAMGLRQRHAVLLIYGMTLAVTGLGLLMMIRRNVAALIVFVVSLLIIVFLFRIVGVIRFRETLTGLKAKYSMTRHRREELKVFEDLQLQFRRVSDVNQWRQAICEAAQRMDFVWVSLKTIYGDEGGRVEEEIWMAPARKPDLGHIMTVAIPLRNEQAGISRQLEFAIPVNGSLETATRQATLFGRLIDEKYARSVTSTT